LSIHGVKHYIHSSTALNLIGLLNDALDLWETKSLDYSAKADPTPLSIMAVQNVTAFRRNRRKLLDRMARAVAEEETEALALTDQSRQDKAA
jgi:hypothetical protein